MGSKAGRPRVLNREIRELIADYATSNRYMSREALANELDKVISEKGYNPPSFETLKKYISEARQINESPEDFPWSLGLCSKYKEYFPVDSIPLLINFLKKYQNELATPMSIRYAKWIVRLSPIIRILKNVHDEKFYDMMVKAMAWQYAKGERISEILGDNVFDTSYLDKKNFVEPQSDEEMIEGYFIHLEENLNKQGKFNKKDGE